MRRRGFTLIELLVVIAIIAILAAILFPVFARARAKAQQNNCLANIKQLTLGVLMYASDYDTRLPISWDTVGNYNYWNGKVYPYVKNLQIYACPSSNTVPVFSTVAAAPAGTWDQVIPTDYRLNPCLGARGGGPGCGSFPTSAGPHPPLPQEGVHRPAEMIMLFETGGTAEGGWGNGGGYSANPNQPDTITAYQGGTLWVQTNYNPTWRAPAIAVRHNTGSNVGYVDGHAKWLSASVLYAQDGSAGWENTP